MMNKRSNVKQLVKKSGSLESTSDRSISPNDILEVKENKPSIIQNRSQSIAKRTGAVKSDHVKTGITKLKPTTKTSSKTSTVAKPSPVKQTKASSNVNSSKLQGPRVRSGTQGSATVNSNTNRLRAGSASATLATPKTTTPTKSPLTNSNLNSRSPRHSNDSKNENPTWKVPSANRPIGKPSPVKPSTVKPLPGRGGPKKLKKVYNPPSLFSLCRTAVSSIINPPEVNDEAKEFLKRRLYGQAMLGLVWGTLTKETKSSRITKEALITERDELASELSELKATLETRVTRLTQQHSDTVSHLTNTLVTRYEEETKLLREDYEQTIAGLRSKLSEITEVHGNEVRYVRETHALEIATLHKEHEEQRNQLIADHQGETTRLESVQRDLEEQNEYLDSQIKEREDNMQIEIDAQVQTQVQRYSTINAELQSLRDVIDMRNAEIKKLNAKIKELEIKAQDIPALEKDLQSFRDHNEQLRATIEMKTEAERSLNITQETLYNTIREKESTNKSVVLKCEELQFRLAMIEEAQGPTAGNNGLFTPVFNSTPVGSPRRQFSEPAPATTYADSPKPGNRPKSQVNLFGAMEAASQILPLHE